MMPFLKLSLIICAIGCARYPATDLINMVLKPSNPGLALFFFNTFIYVCILILQFHLQVQNLGTDL